MKLKEIYDLVVRAGIEADPRGKEGVSKVLSRAKEKYEKMTNDEKEFFDTEKLTNPYSDTRILAGAPSLEITGILAGIDLEGPEALLADRLNERGKKINLLLAHHPKGRALAGLSEVVAMQADIWHKQGVPINIGDVLVGKRMKEVFRSFMPINHQRAVDTARALGFAYLSVHTPADNLVTRFVQKELDAKRPETLEGIVKVLREIPEYHQAAREGAGPTILVGDPEKRAGKIVVDMTGGTESPEEAVEKLAQAGVGTLISMHMGTKLRRKAEKSHINVVIAGHTASDGIGLNLVLDKLEGQGIEIISCSGLRRVSRI